MEQYTAFAAWYDRMMGTVAYEDWARYLDGLLQEAGAKTVAECACGTGNLTWRLIKAGYSVTALDISEDMLLTAREKLRKWDCPVLLFGRICVPFPCIGRWTRWWPPATG